MLLNFIGGAATQGLLAMCRPLFVVLLWCIGSTLRRVNRLAQWQSKVNCQ